MKIQSLNNFKLDNIKCCNEEQKLVKSPFLFTYG